MLGWGTRLLGSATGGLWLPKEKDLHINILEMMAGTTAVKTFATDRSSIHIHIRMEAQPVHSGSGCNADSMAGTPSICLQKIAGEKATVVLIASVWCHQPSYPLPLDALVEKPALLPLSHTLLLYPINQSHPLVLSCALQLTAWKVSSKDSLQQVFQSRLF